MIRVYYDANALFVDTRPDAFVAGTLSASAIGNTVSITGLHDPDAIVAADFSLIQRQDGSGFGDVAACLVYLATQFAMRRALGFQFTQNQASSSWAIAHRLGFFPAGILVLDTAGDSVLGDVAVQDANNLTINFSAPLSGTAYLS